MCTIIMDPNNGPDPIQRLAFFYQHFDCCTYHNYQAQIGLLKQIAWSDYWVKSGSMNSNISLRIYNFVICKFLFSASMDVANL